jgi:hypothetical protein
MQLILHFESAFDGRVLGSGARRFARGLAIVGRLVSGAESTCSGWKDPCQFNSPAGCFNPAAHADSQ